MTFVSFKDSCLKAAQLIVTGSMLIAIGFAFMHVFKFFMTMFSIVVFAFIVSFIICIISLGLLIKIIHRIRKP